MGLKILGAACWGFDVQASLCVRGLYQCSLCRSTGHGQTCSGAILVESCLSNDALNVVIIFQCGGKGLKGYCSYATIKKKKILSAITKP